MKRYEIIEHTADIGIRIFGRDKKELLLNAAYGFFDVITDLKKIEIKSTYYIEVRGETFEELFFNWLDELLFVFDTKGFIGKDVKIEELKTSTIKAKLKGEKFDFKKHPLKAQIKAVTYHNLNVTYHDNLWEAEVLFDI